MESAILQEGETKKRRGNIDDDDKMMDEEHDAARTCTKVALTSEQFYDSVQKYLDENKPNPLVRKQIESWVFEWRAQNDDDDDFSLETITLFQGDDTTPTPTTTTNSPDLKPKKKIDSLLQASHQISGTLVWKGDYMQVSLQALCVWHGNKEGFLHFVCTASASAVKVPAGVVNNNNNNNNNSKAANIKIHEKMVERLEKDDYVQKLRKNNSKKNNILCQADVRCATTSTTTTKRQKESSSSSSSLPLPCEELEERVFTDETLAEGIRRAVWSSSNDSDAIDVFDLVLKFPFLPCTVIASTGTPSSSSTTTAATTTTALADRSQLRLLEDAMYDACEKEGDDELVQELEIQDSKRNKR